MLKNEINNDRPGIANIRYFNQDNKDVGHFVVVYGTQKFEVENQEINGFVAHFGWDYDSVNTWFPEFWVDSCITMRTQHNHKNLSLSDKTAIDLRGHIYSCKICDGVFVEGSHTYTQIKKLESYNEDVDRYHIKTCDCGYKKEWTHDFSYESVSAMRHRKICSTPIYNSVGELIRDGCGYSVYEEHFYKYNTCYYCGYEPN